MRHSTSLIPQASPRASRGSRYQGTGLRVPHYRCIPFRADFSFDNQVKRSDLALVHQSLSHWFVVEIELVSHSLMGHVVPQVRCFRYGEPFSIVREPLVRGDPRNGLQPRGVVSGSSSRDPCSWS